jgi:hypothetical protein
VLEAFVEIAANFFSATGRFERMGQLDYHDHFAIGRGCEKRSRRSVILFDRFLGGDCG